MNSSCAKLKCFVIMTAVIIFMSQGCFAEKNPYYIDPVDPAKKGDSVELGGCRFSILSPYLWRDWMPIVRRPGPDGGSPLRGKLTITADNTNGAEQIVSFRIAVIDDKGQSHSVPFTTDPESWDGNIAAGDVAHCALHIDNGPYLPAGSIVSIELTVTDQKGESVTVKSPDIEINRTD
jgi:hypothetical protein